MLNQTTATSEKQSLSATNLKAQSNAAKYSALKSSHVKLYPADAIEVVRRPTTADGEGLYIRRQQ